MAKQKKNFELHYPTIQFLITPLNTFKLSFQANGASCQGLPKIYKLWATVFKDAIVSAWIVSRHDAKYSKIATIIFS